MHPSWPPDAQTRKISATRRSLNNLMVNLSFINSSYVVPTSNITVCLHIVHVLLADLAYSFRSYFLFHVFLYTLNTALLSRVCKFSVSLYTLETLFGLHGYYHSSVEIVLLVDYWNVSYTINVMSIMYIITCMVHSTNEICIYKYVSHWWNAPWT